MTLNIGRYVKRPVTIEAVQVTEQNIHEVAEWCGGHVEDLHPPEHTLHDPVYYLLVPTLEGVMRATIGSYVIRGIQGEFYPCKPDIMHDTYDYVGVVSDPMQLELDLGLDLSH